MSKLKSLVKLVLMFLHLDNPQAIAVALSPIYVSAAGLVVAFVAKVGLPVNLNPTEIVSLFATGATLISAKLLVWLNGAQKLKQLAVAHSHELAQLKVSLGHELDYARALKPATNITVNANGPVDTVRTARDIRQALERHSLSLEGAHGPDDTPPPAHPLPAGVTEIGTAK